MELTLHPLDTRCCVSGRVFQEGDRVVCYLVREPTGEIGRRDLLATEDAAFAKPEYVYCRWVVAFKVRHAEDNPERTLKLTAESLFTTLADPANEPNPANAPLLQFLALMLERKRLLKPRGQTPDGGRRIYEHVRTHQMYEVPAGTLDDAFFLRIREQLGVLVGEPKAKPGAAAPANPSPASPTDAPAAGNGGAGT